MTQKPTPVVKVPPITPELLDQNEQQQQLWRKQFSLPHQSSVQYAHTVVADQLAVIDTLEQSYRTARRPDRPAIRHKMQADQSMTPRFGLLRSVNSS
jgi:hypothetical protein